MTNALSILIVEDEQLYADLLEDMIAELGHRHLATLADGETALTYMEQQRPDLVLMDVHLAGALDGIEVADALQEKGPLPVIFITSQVDDYTYARAKATQPYAFLEKTARKRQLQRSIDLVIAQLHKPVTPTSSVPEVLMIKVNQSLKRIVLHEVLFIQAEDHYCTLHTATRTYSSRISLTELLRKLPGEQFVRTHRAYVVNLNAIVAISTSDQTIEVGGHHIPLGRAFKAEVMRRVKLI